MSSRVCQRISAGFYFLIFTCAGLFPTYGVAQRTGSGETIYAIKNVNVIPMAADNKVIYKATVIIRNKRIQSLNGSVPTGATVIDGKGKWLIPGLTDMHVHVPADFHIGPKLPVQAANVFFDPQDIMTPYIANGVTTIFNLNASAESFALRNEIAKGNVIGPQIALAALIDGGNGSGRDVNTAEDARQAVRSARAEGYEFIKVYSSLNVETYQAIIDEARIQGLKTVGHIPNAFRGKLEQAFVPHFGMVAHAEEFAKHAKDFSENEAERFAALAKENGTWLTPTLTAMMWIASQVRSLDQLRAQPAIQYVHPLLKSKWLTANNYNKDTTAERIAYFGKMVGFNNRLVLAFKKAGVPMVAGTDTGVSGVVSGFALHDELELLVEAGLTPEEALNSATNLPAIWLGIASETGTIEPGKRADLVLLDANPLDDIKNTRAISGVFVNGRWLARSFLDKMLSDLSKRNLATKDQYNWKDLMRK